MELTKRGIIQWLRSHNRDRTWLAAQCGVSDGTVNNWFSRGLSNAALATIAALMKLDRKSSQDESSLVKFSTGEFERIETARSLVGNPPRPVFHRNAIIKFVDDLNKDKGGQS